MEPPEIAAVREILAELFVHIPDDLPARIAAVCQGAWRDAAEYDGRPGVAWRRQWREAGPGPGQTFNRG